MTKWRRKWLIIGAASTAALVFVSFKVFPIGRRMYEYSDLNETALALPLVSVQCEDQTDSTSGTLVDLGYAEFRLTEPVELRRVARSDSTGQVEMVSLNVDGEQCIVFRPGPIASFNPVPGVESTHGGFPVGWSEWVWKQESCEQFQSEYVRGKYDEEVLNPAVVRTFEFSMLVQHVRPLRFIEIARMSDTDMGRYLNAAYFKQLCGVFGSSVILFHREHVVAIAERYSFWTLHLWQNGYAFVLQIYLPQASDELPRQVFMEIVSTFRVKAGANSDYAEWGEQLDAAYEGK